MTVDAKQSDRGDIGPLEGRREGPVEEVDPAIEQAEAAEALPDEVQVGGEARRLVVGRKLPLTEAVCHPDPGGGELVGVEVAAQEDRRTAASGAAVDQIAAHPLLGDH